MNTKEIILVACLAIVIPLLSIEQAHLDKGNSIIHLSSGPAASDLIERLSYVKDLMIQRGLFDKNKQIYLGYLNQDALHNLSAGGCSTKYNGLTNGVDTILVEKHLDDLPQDQKDSALAHELAHIALRDKGAHLNPHNWLECTRLRSAEMARWIGMPLLALSVIGTQEDKPLTAWRKKCAYTGLSCLGLAVCNTLLIPLMVEAHDTYNPNQPLEYRIMQKSEEVMCDIIAATILPQGGKKGVELYGAKMTHNGNRNGHDGDHPYTATRIWYHKKIDFLQQLVQKY